MSVVFKIHVFLIKNHKLLPTKLLLQTSFRSIHIHIHKFQSYEFRVSFSRSFGCCCCRQCTHCTKWIYNLVNGVPGSRFAVREFHWNSFWYLKNLVQMLWRRLVRTRVQLLSKDDALLEIAGHRMCPIYQPIAENVHAQIQFSSECANFKLEMTSIKLLVLYIATICCRYKIIKSFKFHLWILIWLNSTNFNFVQNAFQQITFWTNWNYSLYIIDMDIGSHDDDLIPPWKLKHQFPPLPSFQSSYFESREWNTRFSEFCEIF